MFVHRHSDGREQYDAVMSAVKACPDLVELGKDGRGEDRFTSRDMIETERRLSRAADLMAERERHRVSDADRERALAAAETHGLALSGEQRAAFEHATGGRDLGVVVGYAGTGKSAMLGVAREAWESAGLEVRGAALSGIAAEGLEHGSGIALRTIAAHEHGWAQGRDPLTARDVLVIDEAGMVGTRQMERVLSHAADAGAKVVLVGDPQQLQTIEAGAALRAIHERHGGVEITEVRRQHEGSQQDATRHLATGRTGEAIAAYAERDMVHAADTREAARGELLARWDRDRRADPDASRIILTHTNDEVRELNEAARGAMRASGDLGDDVAIKVERGDRALRVNGGGANGVSVAYTRDARDNITQTRITPKGGSANGADIVTSATFDVTCVNMSTCNQPNTTTDELGNVTQYSYHPSGGVATVTSPRDASGVSPQTRNTYVQQYAYYKNAAGTIVPAATPVWRLTQSSICTAGTAPGCVGTANELRTTIAYGSAGTANNLLPATVTTRSGDGAVSATTTSSYDAVGNVTAVDGPLPGVEDMSYTRYDRLRRATGSIGPDPDGAGALQRGAIRTTYNAASQPTLTEQGTVNGATDSDWAAFSPLTSTSNSYDSASGNLKTETVIAGGVTQSLTQYSYDHFGRVECAAKRMNPASYGALPASACTLGPEGSYGPDRIVKTSFTGGRPTLIQTALGTKDEAKERTLTYTATGKIATLTDANGNLASYGYDAFDRQVRWNFPSKTAKGAADLGDYEEYGYDAHGNRTRLRKRDGSIIAYQYDALNRNIAKIIPERAGLAATNTRDVHYGYDLRGLQTSARFDSGATTSDGLTTIYDALGRVTSSALRMDGVTRTLGYAHDAGGNRTELTWPDGAKTSYAYDALSRMTGLYEGARGSTMSMLGYSYNNRGLRSGQTGRFGQATTFDYDAAGRLGALSHNLTGTAQDVSYSYGYTPASQIAQQSRSNDIYAWKAPAFAAGGYSVNGLNQYVTAGAASFTYDLNGNLASEASTEGTTNYVYDVENRLVSASGAKNATLRYDPLGRLYETVGGGGGTTTRFLTDGDELVAEYDGSGNLLRRFAHGQNVDDPVIWYEGAGTADPRWLHTNHQGSVIAVTDSTGTAIATNSYDPYGIPASGNRGRFQYTGQAWIPELGLYHYKARIYSPSLGRFLQTDPVGYDDQVNLYAYVGNDPINKIDPSGTDSVDCNVDDVTVGKTTTRVVNCVTSPTDSNKTKVTITKNGVTSKPYYIPGKAYTDDKVNSAVNASVFARTGVQLAPGPQIPVNQPYATNAQAAVDARARGWIPVAQPSKGGTQVWRDPKSGMYYTRERPAQATGTSHNGGAWKGATTPEGLNSKETRSGTYDRLLNRIGD